MRQKHKRKPLRRPELLLAAGALLIAAATLLAAGAGSAADDKADPHPEETFAYLNPFEAGEAGTADTGGEYTQGSYVVGYTGVVVVPPGGDAPLQPYGEVTAPPQAAVPPVQAPPVQAPQPVYPVNLNTATQAQLETLPGIGPVKAQAILAWRAANGGFGNANQLIEVNGIGQKTLEGMLPYITW